MRFLNKSFLFGLGLGVALTLVAVQINSVYWQNRMKKARARPFYRFSTFAPTHPNLDPPLLLGYEKPAKEDRTYENWSVRSLDGKRIRLSDLKGKVVFINFWATWCAPCVMEMPGIQKLAESLRNEPIVFLLVTDEDAIKIREFLETAPANLPVYLGREELPKAFRPGGIPTTFILARNGAIVFRQVGAANWDHELSRRFLRSLLR